MSGLNRGGESLDRTLESKLRIAYLTEDLGVHDFRFLHKLSQTTREIFLIAYFFRQIPIEIPKNIRQLEKIKIICYDARSLSRLKKIINFRRILRKIQPDILHVGLVQTCGILAAFSGFHPFLLMPWGSDILINPYTSFYNKIKTKLAINRSDMITCDCKYVKEEIIKLTGYPEKKIVVFPRGIDLSIFNPTENGKRIREMLGWADKKILIMNRAFEPVYGIEYFLDALPIILDREPKTRVILLGSGSLEQKFRQIIKEMNIEKFVYFGGSIPNQEMPLYLNASDVYVTSSLSDGASTSLMEAMACSLPAVVTDVPVYHEWIHNSLNGFIVPRKDSVVLADRIIRLLEDGSLQQRMGQRNLEIAREKADWDNNFKILESIYKRLKKEY